MAKILKYSRRRFTKILIGSGAILAVGGILSKWQAEPFLKVQAEPILLSNSNGDAKIPSVDLMCPVGCGIVARRVDSRLVKIEGNLVHPLNLGRLCPKGNAGIMTLYDPYRIKSPLKRTNPLKGKGVDPKWQEISWDEAIGIIASKMKDVKTRNPKGFVLQSGENQIPAITAAFVSATGSLNNISRDSVAEGALDTASELTWGGSRQRVDVDQCNYLMLFGTNAAAEANTLFMWYTRHIAEARARGMKLIVVEPRLSHSAAIADEWIPIEPGTDSALALAMVNVLYHEGLFDSDFIREATNGPYLVGNDGYFLRQDGQPLIWDLKTNKSVPWSISEAEPAITGSYIVNGIEYKPSFQLLVDLVSQEYTVEKVSKITGIPVETIQRLAEEFGRAALIGSTIMLQGISIPYRPAAAEFYRGVCAHEHGVLNCRALLILNMMVGNIDATGGLLMMNTGDGDDVTGLLRIPSYDLKFPPERVDLKGSFYPLAYHDLQQQVALTILEPEQYRLSYPVEILMLYYVNTPLQVPTENKQIEAYCKVPFVFSIDSYMSEAAELADIVLPERIYLERTDLVPIATPNDRGHALRQPVVEPLYDTRHIVDILVEIAEKTGILSGKDGFNNQLNRHLELKDGNSLDTSKKYTNEAILDRQCRQLYGDSYGLEWFKANSVKTETLKPENKYHRYIRNGKVYRIHLYSEVIKQAGDSLRTQVESIGAAWWNRYQYYYPLPRYVKSTSSAVGNDLEFTLISYKLVEHGLSRTQENAWLMELYGMGMPGLEEPHLTINREDAIRIGISDGDEVWVESSQGKVKIKAIAGGIKSGVVALPNHFGHWAFNRIAKDKGVNPNIIIPTGEGYVDPISGQQAFNDTKVKVYRA